MAIKLIAIDMDDTLLDGTQQVTARTRQAIRLAIDAGVAVTIATGRMFRSALPFAQELELQLPLITYNGAMIRELDSGETPVSPAYRYGVGPGVGGSVSAARLVFVKNMWMTGFMLRNWMRMPDFMRIMPGWKLFRSATNFFR